MTIIPLSEGAFTIDSTKTFIPFIKEQDDLQARPIGSLLVEIQPFLIKTDTKNILIDTGLGFKRENNHLEIHNNLAKHNIKPEDISIVLLSHLHKDHSSGISFYNENARKTQLSFPNANYYINEEEFALATTELTSSYQPEDFHFLKGNPQVIFTGEEGKIENIITYKVTGGHSPHHQVFWIKEKGETIFFGGDVAPQLQQMKSRFIAKYDYDGRKSMELRKEWWQQGAIEHWNFLFYHDIKSPMVQL